MRPVFQISIILISALLLSCSGTKKYFKAAERLEKQGLVNEAAEYYLESLQRKPSNVQARIKLKEVGQKYTSNLASEFFRNYNTNQLESSLETFERMKEFTGRTSALSVVMDYPKGYEEDYQKAIDIYCEKNYVQAYTLVNQKKFTEALSFIKNIKKYNASYKTTQSLEVVAVCEPLYQNAVNCIENKNYSGALNLLNTIKSKTENYKDMQDLLALSSAQQTKSFILFEPKSRIDPKEQAIEDQLFSDFNQAASQKFPYAKIINNTPFKFMPDVSKGGADIDLIQAVRKATGADFFYIYDVNSVKEEDPGATRSRQIAFAEERIKKNDTLFVTEYKPVNYVVVKSSRSVSYIFSYKMINAYTNQIISSQNSNLVAQDAVEFNEFPKPYSGDMRRLFPYNPKQTALTAQYKPDPWRKKFSANTTLKSLDQLHNEVNSAAVNSFVNSVTTNFK